MNKEHHTTATQRFIKKAIEGGWLGDTNRHLEVVIDRYGDVLIKNGHSIWYRKPVERIVLDPEAWKAVGKVEGWAGSGSGKPQEFINAGWLTHMRGLMDALAEGKTIEEYLATIV